MATRRRKRRSLGSPTRQDFQTLATIFCVHQVKYEVVADVAAHFARRNPNFNRTRFIEAARTTCKRTRPWV